MSKNEDKTNVKTKVIKKNVLQGLNINKLSNSRIIQKHLVYVIGLSSSLASKEVKNNNFRYLANTNTSVNMEQL
jgi:hypothetical protein